MNSERELSYEETRKASETFETRAAAAHKEWRSRWWETELLFGFSPFWWKAFYDRDKSNGTFVVGLGPINLGILLPWKRERP